MEEYEELEIMRLQNFEDLPTHLYLKMTDSKFVKIGNAGDHVCAELYDKYNNRGVEFLYVQKGDLRLWQKVQKVFQFKVNESLSAAEKVKEMVLQLGIDDSVIQEADKITQSNLNFLEKKEKSLFDILNEMIKGENYIYEKSLLTSYIAFSIAKNCSWVNSESYKKLGIASLLHDSFLDNEKLSRIENYHEHNLSNQEVLEVKEHINKAITALSKSSTMSSDLDKMIKMHHERPNGKSIIYQVDASKQPQLICLFILSVDFTARIFSSWPNLKLLIDNIEYINSEYNQGNFVSILKAFNKTFEPVSKLGR
ncbi:MAG: hypothetical protein H6622_00905 [Halobacteriovoraceae bacterium]|nr:hypothetical protein [Halobacteriovoraceae bacterium]